jgi:cyclase
MKKKMFFDAHPLLFKQARHLRNHLTDVEVKLWGYLRTKPFGYKFRRQHPIGIYIVDFYCHAYKLIIEVDGSIHNIPEIQQADLARQLSLETDGLQVIRFSNKEIFWNIENVINRINNILQTKSIPPSGGMGV